MSDDGQYVHFKIVYLLMAIIKYLNCYLFICLIM